MDNPVITALGVKGVPEKCSGLKKTTPFKVPKKKVPSFELHTADCIN